MLDDIKDLLCDEEYDPVVRMQLEDLVMMMEDTVQEDLLYEAYMKEEPLPELVRSDARCMSPVWFDLEDKENIPPYPWSG